MQSRLLGAIQKARSMKALSWTVWSLATAYTAMIAYQYYFISQGIN